MHGIRNMKSCSFENSVMGCSDIMNTAVLIKSLNREKNHFINTNGVHLNIFLLGTELRYQFTGDAGTFYYHDTLQATIGKNLFKVTYI